MFGSRSLQTHMRSEIQIFDDRQKILTSIDHFDFTRGLGCRDLAPERFVSRLGY